MFAVKNCFALSTNNLTDNINFMIKFAWAFAVHISFEDTLLFYSCRGSLVGNVSFFFLSKMPCHD